MEANHGAVLDPDVFQSGELRVELTPGLVGELGQGILQAPLQELRRLGGETR